MVRLIGFPTLETNSSHAASSQGPAQRQTTSLRDRDEYRVGLGVVDILLFLGPAVNAKMDEMTYHSDWASGRC
jgi:hypothetical protein